MRKILLLTLLVIGLVMAAGNRTYSNFPRLIQYQAVLEDSTGTPLSDTTVSIQFDLFDVSVGGASLWSETSNFSLVEGLMNHYLGSIVALPDPLFTDHDSLWLELIVEMDTLAPRVLLTPSAYSMRVATIDQAKGGDVFGDVQIHSDLLVGDHLGSTGKVFVYDGNGPRITMLGAEVAGESSLLALSSINSQHVIELDAEDSVRIAHIRMYHKADLTFDAAAAQEDTLGSQIRMMTHAGQKSIEINAEYPGSGDPRGGPDARGEGRIGVNADPDSGAVHAYSNNRYTGYFINNYGQSYPVALKAEFVGGNVTDPIAVWGESWPSDGKGSGALFRGGEHGVRAIAEGGDADYGVSALQGYAYGNNDGSRYGVYGIAQGGNVAYGVYGFASQGNSNWSSYFAGDNWMSQLAIGTDFVAATGTHAPTPNGYALAVGGKVLCEEIEVMLEADWPDYVFEEDYDLMSLPALEQSIKQNGHLPGVPSAEEVADGGLALGAMQATLLQKMEEMTLHMIALNKNLEEVRQENLVLKTRLAAVEGGQ